MNRPINIAVALEYDGDSAPKVSARGVGVIADEILKIAQEHGVPLQKDNELVSVLADLGLGDEIPEDLYRVVAEVIAFAYILTGKFPKNWRP